MISYRNIRYIPMWCIYYNLELCIYYNLQYICSVQREDKIQKHLVLWY